MNEDVLPSTRISLFRILTTRYSSLNDVDCFVFIGKRRSRNPVNRLARSFHGGDFGFTPQESSFRLQRPDTREYQIFFALFIVTRTTVIDCWANKTWQRKSRRRDSFPCFEQCPTTGIRIRDLPSGNGTVASVFCTEIIEGPPRPTFEKREISPIKHGPRVCSYFLLPLLFPCPEIGDLHGLES